jgi:hypothetical protein
MLTELMSMDDIKELVVGTQIFMINRHVYHSYILSGRFGEYRAVDGADKIYVENRREKYLEDKFKTKSPEDWLKELESVPIQEKGYVYVINPFSEKDSVRIFRMD